MSERLSAMAWLDALASSPGDSEKGVPGSRSVAADVLLLKTPAEFDGVEVVRVGRKIEDADAASPA